MDADSWRTSAAQEMVVAREARSAGNERLARVCARRAAGYIAAEYLRRQGIELSSASAITRLQYLKSIPDLPSTITETVDHFLVRITADHMLPIEADLIKDVYFLAEQLLDEELRA